MYEHDIIISYRRTGSWTSWVRDLFIPTLQDFICLEFARPITVYADAQLAPGTNWEDALNVAIDKSRIMIPVFMNSYFHRERCRRELSRMLHRESQAGFRTRDNPDGLVVPIRLSDRKYFPEFAARIQDENFTEFALPTISGSTPTHEKFCTKVREFCKTVSAAIRRAPQFDPNWAKLDGTPYYDQLAAKPDVGFDLPRLT